MASLLFALSYSSVLVDLLTTNHQGMILSSHQHACNLRLPTGEIIALVSPHHGNGPFHVVVPQAALHAIHQGDAIQLTPQAITSPRTNITLTRAIQWSPLVAWPESVADASLLLHETKITIQQSTAELPPAAQRWLSQTEPLINRCRAGLHLADPEQLNSSLQQFIGLGPGLTPAGDDLLVGLLAGLYLHQAQAKPGLSGDRIGVLVASLLEGRTTQLSKQWLHHAARSEFGAAWHDLAAALTGQSSRLVQQALRRIGASGVTSGLAALIGFSLTLSERTAHSP